METTVKHARIDEDGTPRGVDVQAVYNDIKRLCLSFWRANQALFKAAEREGRAGRRLEAEDFVQEVALTIHRRNAMASAFDPRRASFSKYVHLIARTVASHAVERAEPEALFADPADLGNVSLPAAPELALDLDDATRARIRGVARSIERDMAIGQLRIFDAKDELQDLAASAA